MSTTLLQPKVSINKWTGKHIDVVEFERHIEELIDDIKGNAVVETIKITWLPIRNQGLYCIIEWCEWVNENHKD